MIYQLIYNYKQANAFGTNVELYAGKHDVAARLLGLWREHVGPDFFKVPEITLLRLEPVKLSDYSIMPADSPEDEEDLVDIGPWFEWVKVPIEWPEVPSFEMEA